MLLSVTRCARGETTDTCSIDLDCDAIIEVCGSDGECVDAKTEVCGADGKCVCQPGYQDVSFTCTACGEGKYSYEHSSCKFCEEGKYQGEEGQAFCEITSSGRFAVDSTNTSVSKGATRDLPVTSGNYLCDNTTNVNETGSGVVILASDQCTCPKGSTATTTGATECTCEPGWELRDGTFPCTPCQIGYWKYEEGNFACYGPAPMGYYTDGSVGSSGALRIIKASAGYYTADSDNNATSSGAVKQLPAGEGNYSVDSHGEATYTLSDGGPSSGGVNQAPAPIGKYACLMSAPSGQPTMQPTRQPTMQPTMQPSGQPTGKPKEPSTKLRCWEARHQKRTENLCST